MGEEKVKEHQKTLDKGEPSIEKVEKELNEALDHNRNVESINKYRDKQNEYLEKKSQYESLGKDMTSLLDEKKKIFASGKMPLKGLTFEEDTISYNEIPLEQINKSTLIALGIKIQMLKNPNLKVMVIKDGSLIDEKLMNKLMNFCDKNDYQLIVEMVDAGGEKDLTIEFQESNI